MTKSDAKASSIFVKPSEDDWKPTEPGIRRRLLTHDDRMMMVEVAFEEGKRLEGACREGGGHSSGGGSVCVCVCLLPPSHAREGAGTSFPPS